MLVYLAIGYISYIIWLWYFDWIGIVPLERNSFTSIRYKNNPCIIENHNDFRSLSHLYLYLYPKNALKGARMKCREGEKLWKGEPSQLPAKFTTCDKLKIQFFLIFLFIQLDSQILRSFEWLFSRFFVLNGLLLNGNGHEPARLLWLVKLDIDNGSKVTRPDFLGSHSKDFAQTWQECSLYDNWPFATDRIS